MEAPVQIGIFFGVAIILCVALYLFAASIFRGSMEELVPPPEGAAYKDPGNSIDARTEDLLSRMSLAEKAGQMALVDKNSIKNIEDVRAYGLGALLSGAGAKPVDNTREGWRKMVGDFIGISRENRLDIPILYGVDAIHGHSNVPGATVFPHFIGLGAANDPDLTKRMARAVAEELRATGIYWSYSPTLDMPADIRWGRVYETFSDDPARVATLGAAYVEGLQDAEGERALYTLATPKHFVGAGDMVWGSSSNKDFEIDQGTTPPNEILLRERYLPPFQAAIDAGARSIMVGLNSWGDTKLSADKHLITDVLKEEMGFKGFIVSDWYGVYEIPGSDHQAAVIAINAGVDLVMLPFDYKPFVRNVMRAVSDGEIPEARIDDAVRRILRAKFELGLFDEQKEDSADTFGSKEHRTLAREAVARSLVLLKNDGPLPIIGNAVKSIRVAGSAADNVGRQSGAWTIEWQGVDGNWLPGGTSILKGLQERVGQNVTVEYLKDGNFGKDIDVVDLGIAVVGEAPYAEGWGDKAEPVLDAADLVAIERLRAASKRLIVIIVSGRPLILDEDTRAADALIAAWLPGSEGRGVADVLFGDRSFVGTLPLPWPKNIGQLPFRSDGRGTDGSEALYARGFGILGTR